MPALADVAQVRLIDFDLVRGPGGGGPQARGSRLLLHGFGGDKHQLRALGDAFPQEDGMISMYPSLRAHGASPKPPWGYSVLDFAADVHRVADLLPAPIDLIGYSYGALVGAVSALTWGVDLVRSLTVIDQSFEGDPAQYVKDEWAEGSYLRWMYRYAGMLERLGIPVLLLTGRDSPMVSSAERDRLLARCGPRLEVAAVPGTHATCLDDPAALAALIKGFHERNAGCGNRRS
jgi:pimeloyl-ACP methyl ester carboxylesterase